MIRRFLSLMLIAALALALCGAAYATAIDESLFDNAPERTPAPTAALVNAKESKLTDDGMLRVWLRSLGAPERLTLTIAGPYTIEHDSGFRFERDAQVVLAVSNGEIYMSVSGLTMRMGSSVTFTRQATQQRVNGLYIEESRVPENLFAGDLTVSVENEKLRAVLSIDVESYLLGVVAYEMSDSWPLEALKAQAVASRTYALKRKAGAAKTDRDYDLVDTTADQVYKGENLDYVNVEAAVEATRGVVLTEKDDYITAFYTASNGGEVALPSDVGVGSDSACFERKADPYDLANPNSLVGAISFASDVSDCEALKNMLQEALTAWAQENKREAESLQVDRILSIEPAEPEPAESSMYRKLRFTLSVTGESEGYAPTDTDIGAPVPATGSADADAALRAIDYIRRLENGSAYQMQNGRFVLPDSVTVDLSVYDQIKKNLNIGLNGTDIELVSVKAEDERFTIEMRRYGHGAGMSQRGAQRMAGVEGFAFDAILSFYYPGADIARIKLNIPELTALESLGASVGFERPQPTPTPTPAPLRALNKGEYYAVVALGDAASALNVRESPGTQYAIVNTLPEGRRVIVLTEADANGWVEITAGDCDGYVKLEYLKAE